MQEMKQWLTINKSELGEGGPFSTTYAAHKNLGLTTKGTSARNFQSLLKSYEVALLEAGVVSIEHRDGSVGGSECIHILTY